VNHIVEYDENDEGTQCWAKCSCRERSPRMRGSAVVNTAKLDRWAERHIDQNS